MTDKKIQQSYKNYKTYMRQNLNKRYWEEVVEIDGKKETRKKILTEREKRDKILTFGEYEAQYLRHVALHDALAEQGTLIPVSIMVANESFDITEPKVKALYEVLLENGVEVDKDDLRADPTSYYRLARTFYNDNESYDAAMSSAYGW